MCRAVTLSMRASRTTYVRLLSLLIAGAASPVLGAACGGQSESTPGTSGGPGSSGTSGGTSGATSGGTSGATSGGTSGTVVTTGCGSPATATSVIDATQCRPQVQSQTTCGGSVCSWTVEQPCTSDGGIDDDAGDSGDSDSGDGGVPEAGSQAACQALCNAARPAGVPLGAGGFCYMGPQDGGAIIVQCGGCGVGRPPRGFVARPAFAPNAVAERLAQMTQLEAASVDAFHALHADLLRHGAPAGLRRAVLAAADDEVRHARATRREAERFGASVPFTPSPAARPRSLEELAIENAEEGCVNETFGAALAALQAERATDLRVRRMMTVIAREELGHAALSWELAAWLAEQLDGAGRARVAEARRGAVSALFDDLAGDGPGSDVLGLPDAATSRMTLAAMAAALETGDLSLVATRAA